MAATTQPSRVVIYNAVPKTGSRGLEILLKLLGKAGGFRYESARLGQYYPQEEEMRLKIHNAANEDGAPFFYQNHARFFRNTSLAGSDQIIWINIVREPLSRFRSWFYFHAQLLHDDLHVPPKDSGCVCPRDFDACVKVWMTRSCLRSLNGREIRSKSDWMATALHEAPLPQWQHFCDWRPGCTVHDAIRNMQHGYAVVGLTDEFELTLALLERKLPAFFRGAVRLYSKLSASPENVARIRHSTSDHYHTNREISTTARNWLRTVEGFAEEQLFYEAAKRHFWLQSARQGNATRDP